MRLHLPVRGLVSAHLDVGPLVAVGEPRLRHLQRPLLLPVRLTQLRYRRLRVRDLVHRLQEQERIRMGYNFARNLNPILSNLICINGDKVGSKVTLERRYGIAALSHNFRDLTGLLRIAFDNLFPA